jgi:phosphatidylglycerol:prolipoprotein diacylglycerol transferase
MLLAYLIHHPTPYLGPHWGQIGIRFYGLGFVLGFIAAALLFSRYARARRSQLPASKIPDLMTALVVGVMVGGRLGSFLLYRPAEILSDPLAVFRIWEPGMASHGGFIGVAIALWWFSHRARISFLHLGDLIVSAAPVGLFLVRIANFLNGELWGKVTSVPWAIIFDESGGGPLPRHPSQFYEAALEGGLLFGFVQWRFWRTPVVATHPGRLAGEFLVGYALVRIISEVFREPDASLIWGMSRGTFYSLFLILVGSLLIARIFHPKEPNQAPEPTAPSGCGSS